MLTILSPAKTLDFETPSTFGDETKPALIKEAAKLADRLRRQSPGQLAKLMKISINLAELNHARFADWRTPHPKANRTAAIAAFQGDVYRGLKADRWTSKQIDFAQGRLRILSGLYGVLRPLDFMLPYRLEMSTQFKIDKHQNLYAFWSDKIAKQLTKQIVATKSPCLLNLASNEYFKSVDRSVIDVPIVSPAFKEFKNGAYKNISVFTKVARGTMASWVIQNRVKSPRGLVKFDQDGYRYDSRSSTKEVPVFLRGGN